MGVVVLFALGMIVTVAGIVRTWYIYKSLMAEHDNTWYAYPLWIAAAVEIDLGVVSLTTTYGNLIAPKPTISNLDLRLSARTPSAPRKNPL